MFQVRCFWICVSGFVLLRISLSGSVSGSASAFGFVSGSVSPVLFLDQGLCFCYFGSIFLVMFLVPLLALPLSPLLILLGSFMLDSLVRLECVCGGFGCVLAIGNHLCMPRRPGGCLWLIWVALGLSKEKKPLCSRYQAGTRSKSLSAGLSPRTLVIEIHAVLTLVAGSCLPEGALSPSRP